MRTFLLVVIALEGSALVGGAGALFLFGEDLERRPPDAPVFRPLLPEAVTGDSVRYRREDRRTGEVLGYRDYRVKAAYELEGFGREFHIEIEDRWTDARPTRARILRVRPRSNEHGFLPPGLNEDELDLVPGLRPVIKRIGTAPVKVFERERPGFLVETVVPRDSLTEVKERLWMTEFVPVFGVARWEREDEVLILHQRDWAAR